MLQSNKVCIYNRKRKTIENNIHIQFKLCTYICISKAALHVEEIEWRQNEEDVNKGESKNTFIIYDL